jgi:exopolyphosphatase/guanosine-5'-triphosphate,3'-diphosphate pyrophosphatase
MKCASIDVGTNTALLMIAEVTDRIEEISDIATITRLGEGLKKAGFLSDGAMERTLNALRRYRAVIDESHVEEVLCVGTAALREAKNRNIFLERAYRELSFPIQVISERDEAFYNYLSVRQGLRGTEQTMIIIDIGGGSTEVICGTREKLLDFISLPVGSVKLTEMFVKSDPPSEGAISSLRDYVRSILELPFGKGEKVIIGTAGTITTLGSISIGLAEWDKKQVHHMRIRRERIDDIVNKLLTKTIEERIAIPGMEKGRADIISQGIILLQEIMQYCGADELIIDANGVRHGLLCQKLELASSAPQG